jgi:aminoglycoside 2'-N-acetyltransferase I
MSPSLSVCASDEISGADRARLWELWQAAFDGRQGFDRHDEEHTYGGVHVLARSGEEILGHAAVVPREIVVGERPFAAGYVEGVAVLPARQRTGVGRAVMRLLMSELRARHDLGVLSTGRARGFYERLGWERWRGPSYVLTAGGPLRTAADDDGLMVLRFGPSAGVDLTAAIACHDRSGDVW